MRQTGLCMIMVADCMGHELMNAIQASLVPGGVSYFCTAIGCVAWFRNGSIQISRVLRRRHGLQAVKALPLIYGESLLSFVGRPFRSSGCACAMFCNASAMEVKLLDRNDSKLPS